MFFFWLDCCVDVLGVVCFFVFCVLAWCVEDTLRML